MGTAYYLRLTAGSLEEAARRGAKTDTSWTSADGQTRDLGADWIVGGWVSAEIAWCASTFAQLRGCSP